EAVKTGRATAAAPSARASTRSRRKCWPTSRPWFASLAVHWADARYTAPGGAAFMTRSSLVVALALALVACAVAPARAGAPTDQVREYTDAVIKVLEDPALKAEDKKPERRAAVRKIATEVFDVQETARRALGPHWQQRTPQPREAIVQRFAELLEQTRISKIGLCGGGRLRFTAAMVD